MTQGKQLLLADLSARVPYDVKCKIEMWKGCDVCTVFSVDSIGSVEIVEDYDTNGVNIERIKPYLFPLSSMTEKQEMEYGSLVESDINGICYDTIESIDYLIANHFDFRNLIGRGLAIDCTNLNIY